LFKRLGNLPFTPFRGRFRVFQRNHEVFDVLRQARKLGRFFFIRPIYVKCLEDKKIKLQNHTELSEVEVLKQELKALTEENRMLKRALMLYLDSKLCSLVDLCAIEAELSQEEE